MSLPQNVITTVPYQDDFLPPRNEDYDPLISLHFGGTALNDPSAGRLVKVWTFYWNGTSVYVTNEDLMSPTLLFNRAGVLSISGAFDSNMQPVVAYRDATGCFVWYFDALASAFIHKQITGANSIQCSVDDLRPFFAARSDVIVGYTKSGVLYWRQQRDRYDDEYTAGPAAGTLTRVGQNNQFRYQFEVDPKITP